MIDEVKAIDEKYCKDDLLQLMPCSDDCQLIMDTDEILFLKIRNNVLINKYINHPKRYIFPYSNNEKYHGEFNVNYNQLFEYNKPYLNFKGSVSGCNLCQNTFYKGSKRALYTTRYLNLDDRGLVGEVAILSRDIVERLFDGNEYDSMYVIDRNGDIIFAKSKTDGVVIDRKLIPSDDEIVKNEYDDRIFKRKMPRKIMNDFKESDLDDIKPKAIEEIKDYNIYGPNHISSNKYNHLLITSREGKFEIKWFKLDYVEHDTFKLTTNNISVLITTIDDVINYSKNNDIRYTSDPIINETNESVKEVITRIPKDDLPKITLDLDKEIDKEQKNKEKGFSKILKRVLKNN